MNLNEHEVPSTEALLAFAFPGLKFPRNPDPNHLTPEQQKLAIEDPTYPARLSRWQKFNVRNQARQ